ncbi:MULTISPECIES: RHS repeat-associated core domain-containing protein [Stenotrophomonas]|nr:RHS repeat-associated core domain-containing protein [Stenotrophomonas maltophilia]
MVGGQVTDGPGYTGHVSDSATGLSYMQQRYMDPQLGVFLSVDPVTAYEQPVGQFNRYRYANGNPYRFTDPDGRDIVPFGDVEGVRADLKTIGSKPEGRALIDRLEKSPNIHGIGYAPARLGDPAKTIPSDHKEAGLRADGTAGGGTGSTILIDPAQKIYEAGPNGPVEVPGFVKLGHEMGHADAIDQGIQSSDMGAGVWGTTPGSEEHSMKIENSIRKENGFNERPSYYRESVPAPKER